MSSFISGSRYTQRAVRLGMSALLLTLVLPAMAQPQTQTQPRDPTRPPGVQPLQKQGAAAVTSYRLGSILSGNGRKLAIINGQRVHEGGSVDGAKVLEIAPGSVLILSQGQRRTLKMNGALIKKRLKRD